MAAGNVASDTASELAAGPMAADWWASGDFPVRTGCIVEPLVDGRAAFFAMTVAFLTAKRFILLAGWDIRADLPLVRGGDLRIGDADAVERDRFTQVLRDQGLDDDAIALWQSDHMCVVDVLGFAAKRGVKVGVLLWDAIHGVSHVTNDPEEERTALASAGVDCLLDDSSRAITHITQALHQKCCVVDGELAFLGGIDLTVQTGGDYDRWDTHQHPCASVERTSHREAAKHPWHDVHTRIHGPAVADVQRNITQRWMAVAGKHNAPAWPGELATEPPAARPNGTPAQIARTIPPKTYDFAPDGIANIKQLYLHALRQARRFVYLENQYLWTEVFLGLDGLRWGKTSPDMTEVIGAMAGALRRGVHIALTLPDHPNCGRAFTDGGVDWLREQAVAAGGADRFRAYTLGNSEADATMIGGMFYRPVYTHAKVAIVDDLWWTVGSANLNSRGMATDAEINVGVLDPASAHELRLRLWNEHLHAAPHEAVEDPLTGLATLEAAANANLERVRALQALDGHLLPYLTAADGKRLDIAVHDEHGWLDNLPGGAGGFNPEHAGKYL
ncbi:MAG: phosphatidylserine/phosphatidylglycerophosphate/cardiolipin synthase family protein [Ktedonobacterales bacterium]